MRSMFNAIVIWYDGGNWVVYLAKLMIWCEWLWCEGDVIVKSLSGLFHNPPVTLPRHYSCSTGLTGCWQCLTSLPTHTRHSSPPHCPLKSTLLSWRCCWPVLRSSTAACRRVAPCLAPLDGSAAPPQHRQLSRLPENLPASPLLTQHNTLSPHQTSTLHRTPSQSHLPGL